MSPVKNMMYVFAELNGRSKLPPGIYDVTVEAGELATAARPGQFAHIYVPGKTPAPPYFHL